MRIRRAVAPLCALLLLTAGCAGAEEDEGPRAQPPKASDPADAARELLADMSTKDKIGQLFVPVAVGTTAEENAELIDTHRPGGLIYFPENLEDAEQIATLSNGLQDRAVDTGAGVPLFLGIDQEQGMVSRLPVGARFPDAMAVGATGDPGAADSLARTTAKELVALGINLDYAPTADVNVNADNPVIGIRSFGADPGLVGTMMAAETEAFSDEGVVPVVKHFPGHGDTDVDSHTGLPVVEKSRAEWEKVDLPPFKKAVEDGADAVMTGHVFMPELDDSGEPATLSKNVTTGLLRDELGFDGVVSTDALNMEGVRQTHGDGEVAVRAIEAGADQLLMPPDMPAAVDAVTKAVEKGRISAKRLDASVLRLLELKVKRGLFDAEPVDPAQAESAVGTKGHKAAAQDVADASVTLLRNKSDVLPLREGAKVQVVGEGAEQIGAALEDLGATLTDSAGQADAVVAGTLSARGEADQKAVVTRARDSGTPVIVVAQGNPYDISELPGLDGYLATYSSVGVSRTAAARVVMGKVRPTGTLPVDIPGTDLKTGDGLHY
ncbi:beta-N-acetylhexosaminidase [Murinocardiopsis flavida]|uniref:beta-N-acetylhexosaminidase n=1 Tax=Murinocardiopsis flavida TaxID=645275 RepID=A0A2P8DIT2_9ACTN|nr:glycoside hydrolase family 3 protein [Murinocardiopsis flavida]PSK97135.1 beta-N-acetylhexosaminidase [Murinocardiopsis flavida]